MAFRKYPEIVLVNKRPEIFAVKEVVCAEKIHGSNLRIGLPCGIKSPDELLYGSREVDYDPADPGAFPLAAAMRWVKANNDKLGKMLEVMLSYGFSDSTIYGEAYGPGIKAKGIKYSNGQETLFRAFDIMVGDNFVTNDLFVEITEKMGLPRVHEVWRGPPSMEAFEALLEQPSTEAKLNGVEGPGTTAEGIVIRSNPLLRNVFGEWLICKHKSKKFAEVQVAEPKAPRAASPADGIAAKYVTEGRVDNAIGRLQDRGVEFSWSMKDMPILLDEIVADLFKECGAELQEAGITEPKMLKGAVSKPLSSIYKWMLTNG